MIWRRILLFMVAVGAIAMTAPLVRGEDYLHPSTLNQYRAAHGRSVLSLDPKLTSVALDHARTMAQWNTLDHTGFIEKRVPAGAIAENVAYGCGSMACVINQWARSRNPLHRLNMRLPNAGSYGIASVTSPAGRTYWCMVLGN